MITPEVVESYWQGKLSALPVTGPLTQGIEHGWLMTIAMGQALLHGDSTTVLSAALIDKAVRQHWLDSQTTTLPGRLHCAGETMALCDGAAWYFAEGDERWPILAFALMAWVQDGMENVAHMTTKLTQMWNAIVLGRWGEGRIP